MREIMSSLFTNCPLVCLHASIFLPLTTGTRLDCLHTNQHSQTKSSKTIWADCDSTRLSLCPWIRWVFITVKCKEKESEVLWENLVKWKIWYMMHEKNQHLFWENTIGFTLSLRLYREPHARTYCECKACNRKILRQILKLTSLAIL